MRKTTGIMTALAMLAHAGAASAQFAPQAPLPPAPTKMPNDAAQPTSKWVANFADNSCQMVRDFGAGRDQKQLVLQPVTGSETVQVQVRHHGDALPQPMGGVRLALYPGGTSAVGGYRDTPITGTSYERNITFLFQRGQLGDLANAQVISFLFAQDKSPHAMGTFDRQTKQAEPISLAPGALDQVTKVLKECEDDLVKSWGYDPEAQRSLKTRPIPIDGQKWFTVKDFPTKEQAKDTATPNVRFTVGADGAVTNCIIVDSSNSKVFDDKACELVTTKARYKPATDAAGKPVAALQVMPVARPIVF